MHRAADRFPWSWAILVALCALVAAGLVLNGARSRVRQDRNNASEARASELRSVRQSLDDYLGDAVQLTTATASVANSVRGDRDLVVRLLRGLALSHVNRSVYGIGAFYAPDVFDNRSHRFDPFWALLPNFRYSVDTDTTYNYTQLGWYKAGVAAGGRPVWYGPFFDSGVHFVSIVQAFYDRGRLAGVALEVIAVQDLLRVLDSGLKPGDVAYITTKTGTVLLVTPARNDVPAWPSLHAPVPYTDLQLHVASDPAPLEAARMRVYALAAAEIAGVFAAAAIAMLVLIRLWRSRVAQLQMQRELGLRDEVENRLREAANTDQLTGLPNRRYLLGRLRELIASREANHALVFVDLDRFNVTNDTFGHATGDALLRKIAGRLTSCLPAGGEVARLGGDEFVIVAPATDTGIATGIASKALDALSEPFAMAGHEIYVTASAGVVFVTLEYTVAEDLLRDVDIAMYEAKRRGRARFAIFGPEMRDRVAAESALDHDLRMGLEKGQFVAYYQPIFELATMRVTSAELLARWRRDGRGIVGATEFIPYAETHGLIDAIDEVILAQACEAAHAFSVRFPGASLSVNLSAAHLMRPGLTESILAALRRGGVAPSAIKIEITETAMMSDSEEVRDTLRLLRDMDLDVVVDDFGCGHSSLAYLRHLPISGLKIDRTFVEPLPSDRQALAIVRSILVLAQTLGLYVVAEGVENAEQAELLTELGVTYAQGFYFAHPMLLHDVLRFEPPAVRSLATQQ